MQTTTTETIKNPNKTVFNNGDIPHEWAHQRRPYARNANYSLYFRHRTIFSYHYTFPVATIFPDFEQVLFTSRGYSVTTSRHTHAVHNAIPYTETVDDGSAWGPYTRIKEGTIVKCHKPINWDNDWPLRKSEVIEWLIDEYCQAKRDYNSYLDRASKPRIQQKTRGHKLACAARVIDDIKIVAAFAEKLFYYEKYCQHSRYDDAQTKAKLTSSFRKLVKQINDWVMPADLNQAIAARKAELIAQQKEQQAQAEERKRQRAEQFAGNLLKWRNGEISWIQCPKGFAYLRLNQNQDDPCFVTSRGTSLPLADVKRALVAFRAGHLLGQQLGGYKITQVDSTRRLIVAGCHTVTFDEVEHVAEIVKGLES